MTMESRLHIPRPSMNSDSPERTRRLDSVLDHVQRTLERRLLVLQLDLDQLERRDNDGFGSTSETTSCDREGLGVFLLTVVGEEGAPPSVSCDWVVSGFRKGDEVAGTGERQSFCRQEGGKENDQIHAHSHLIALFGASSIKGGRIPLYSRRGLWVSSGSVLAMHPLAPFALDVFPLPALDSGRMTRKTSLPQSHTTHPSVATMLLKV